MLPVLCAIIVPAISNHGLVVYKHYAVCLDKNKVKLTLAVRFVHAQRNQGPYILEVGGAIIACNYNRFAGLVCWIERVNKFSAIVTSLKRHPV